MRLTCTFRQTLSSLQLTIIHVIDLINFWRGLSPLSSPPSPFAWPSKELLDTWFALSFLPSGSVGCQQDHGYHRQCPTCPPRTSQSHHLKKPSPPKTAHPHQAQIFHPRYHFTACNTVRKWHNRSGRLSGGSSLRDVVWKRELGLLRREVGPLVALCRRPFEAKQRRPSRVAGRCHVQPVFSQAAAPPLSPASSPCRFFLFLTNRISQISPGVFLRFYKIYFSDSLSWRSFHYQASAGEQQWVAAISTALRFSPFLPVSPVDVDADADSFTSNSAATGEFNFSWSQGHIMQPFEKPNQTSISWFSWFYCQFTHDIWIFGVWDLVIKIKPTHFWRFQCLFKVLDVFSGFSICTDLIVSLLTFIFVLPFSNWQYGKREGLTWVIEQTWIWKPVFIFITIFLLSRLLLSQLTIWS